MESYGHALVQNIMNKGYDKGYGDGYDSGYGDGSLQHAHDSSLRMHAQGVPVPTIASFLDVTPEQAQQWIAEKEQSASIEYHE